MRRALFAMAGGAAALTTTACAADQADFKVAAENLIESGKDTKQAGTTFRNAHCEQPAKVRPGESFTCTALDAQGVVWKFDVVVKDSVNFELSGAPQG